MLSKSGRKPVFLQNKQYSGITTLWSFRNSWAPKINIRCKYQSKNHQYVTYYVISTMFLHKVQINVFWWFFSDVKLDKINFNVLMWRAGKEHYSLTHSIVIAQKEVIFMKIPNKRNNLVLAGFRFLSCMLTSNWFSL